MFQTNRSSVIFIDTYNITNSLIAESYLRRMGYNLFNISSAGISSIDISDNDFNMLYKCTRNVLSELGMPIVGLRAGVNYEVYNNKHFDYVIVLSNNARRNCPRFLGSYIKTEWDIVGDEITPGYSNNETEIIKKLRLIRYSIINHIDSFLKSFPIVRRSFF
jgi:protein-tyrosine-phosphatase